jgi:hypothetical protein
LLYRELFTSDIDLMESESKVVFNEREGRGNIDEAGPSVLKTLFDHEKSEDGIKAGLLLIHQRIRTFGPAGSGNGSFCPKNL